MRGEKTRKIFGDPSEHRMQCAAPECSASCRGVFLDPAIRATCFQQLGVDKLDLLVDNCKLFGAGGVCAGDFMNQIDTSQTIEC